MSKHPHALMRLFLDWRVSRRRPPLPEDAAWAALYADYLHVYGVDPAPFWAHRPEWQYHPGVEIDQYRNGH